MITFETIGVEQAEDFWNFLTARDCETACMMYEPEERAHCTNMQELRDDIQRNVVNGNDFLQAAVEDGRIIGYIRAERGKFNRVFHTAYIVTGILAGYTRKGVGTKFFENLENWAKENGILRLELTVERRNEAAKCLYEKAGYAIEGIRVKSMLVDGALIDEYYMAKIL